MTDSRNTAIRVTDLRKVFYLDEREIVAIENANLEILEGTFVSLVGPSGCGKTTMLSVIAGIEEPTAGEVKFFDGRDPRLGYVFQSPRLLPWRSAIDNILYVLDHRSAESRERAKDLLSAVGLEGRENAWPSQLSGGMQQRVGIARALAIDPDVLLMDEPFSHLDAITARSLREHVQRLWLETRKTVLFVTHDVAEAVQLSDRILVLGRGGVIEDDIAIDLPRPRLASDTEVAVLQAEILGRFEGGVASEPAA